MALKLTLPCPIDESPNRWNFTNKDTDKKNIPEKKLFLDELINYRRKENRFGSNIAPDFFARWRFEPDGIYHSITYIFDLEKLRHKSGN